ncbi:MAG: hypothetical protein ACJ796_18815 [Gemmatimonadaceae bacterium]
MLVSSSAGPNGEGSTRCSARSSAAPNATTGRRSNVVARTKSPNASNARLPIPYPIDRAIPSTNATSAMATSAATMARVANDQSVAVSPCAIDVPAPT